MSETAQQEQIDVEASGPVEIPVENACPECGAEIFGHKADGPEAGFWQPDSIEGTISAYRTDDDEIAYEITFDCRECDYEFRERELTKDDIRVTEDDE